MPVDKFGQSSKAVETGPSPRGERGIGFILTADGNYDVMNKRLTKVGTPILPTDAATFSEIIDLKENVKRTLEHEVLSVDASDGNFNGMRKRIRDVAFPRHSNDAANKVYVDRHFLGLSDDKTYFSASQKPIRDLGEPSLPTDAVTKQFVRDNFFTVTSFNALSPMEEKAKWSVGHFTDHVVTHPLILKKVTLYSSDINSTIIVELKIGNKIEMIVKQLGELSTTTTFHNPINVQKNTSMSVSNVTAIVENDVRFQLDAYFTFI
jgi:hypothetical protein